MINNLIDRSIVGMCLFGIWADVHEVTSTAKFFYYISAFYAFVISIVAVVVVVKACYDFKLNRFKK